MKRLLVLLMIVGLLPVAFLSAQDEPKKKGYTLKSEKLDAKGDELDKQITRLNQDLEKLLVKYDLLNTKDIRQLPFQTTYNMGDDFIQMEKHLFNRNPVAADKVVGIRTRMIKIYTDGNKINKIEYVLYNKDYNSGFWDRVTIMDPTPTDGNTGDIEFTHISTGKTVLKNKKLADIKNTTANPVRNELKQDFLVPNLNIFYDAFQFTAEAYYSEFKDADVKMSEFLKQTTRY